MNLPADPWIRAGCIYGAVERYMPASVRYAYTDVLKHPDNDSELPMINVLWPEEQRLRWEKIIKDDQASSSPYIYDHYMNIRDEMMAIFKERQIYRNFLIDHTLKSRRACEEIYKMIGLPAVVSAIEDLKKIIPAEQLPLRDEGGNPLELSHQYILWSVREIYDLVDSTVGGLPPPIDGKISVGEFASMLADAEATLRVPAPPSIADSRISLRTVFGMDSPPPETVRIPI